VAATPGCTGVWPENNLEARSYLFDPSKCHGHDMTITVDGVTTLLGPNYLAGPVTTPPLLDTIVPGVFGMHMFIVGAFIHPLRPGRHTITIAGTIDGPYVQTTLGGSVSFVIPYTVVVA
jgi:hypothetical protein